MPSSTYIAHSSPDLAIAAHQPLAEHAHNTGALAASFAAHFGAGQLHDLGKYCAPFQQRVLGAAIRVNHSTWGAKVALAQYRQLGWLLTYGIAGHHAGLANGGLSQGGQRLSLAERLADPALPALDAAWQREITLPALQELLTEAARKLPRDAPHGQGFSAAFLARMLFSTLVDADYLDTERYYDQFLPPSQRKAAARAQPAPSPQALRAQLDEHLRGFQADSEVNRIRAHILAYARQQATLAPGLFSLTVPTGGGKTLASLAFALDHAIAHGQRRVIFVIPFTSIVEQNAAVFRRALGPHGAQAVLEHHSAFTPPAPDASRPDWHQSQAKLRLSMENWDAPIVVTTAVQFFESLFAARTGACRKLHHIANSVVVLDEAQTLPLHLLRPAVAAIDELARHYQSSIVLCTATQPALQAPRFKGGLRDVRPLVQDEHALARQLERVRVRHAGALDDAALAAELRARAGAVHRQQPPARARLIPRHRRPARHHAPEHADVRAPPQPGAGPGAPAPAGRAGLPHRLHQPDRSGVDISLPTVLRAEAGLDAIVQAAGRCNRNKEWPVERSEVLVFATDEAQWAPPAELRAYAQAAQEVLRQPRQQADPLSPAAIQAYFEALYWQKGEQALDAQDLLGLSGKAAWTTCRSSTSPTSSR
ncbi:CRISPR-associated endonuclease Cas3'' [Vandammella animalimorsus]|uniref:CRISPR-associated endonuclease Cas3'' n=1 Tax=Vandammella animalimorsus TaxID=2029117 RepID=UPI001EED367F|nr:CRISPR-associated endonuclease Cas3'' [Vandammella animalimorsus]